MAASWLDFRPAGPGPLANPATTSFGETRALVRTEGGLYLVSRTEGARGPLAVPSDALWAGLTDGDRILYADRGGAIHAADGPDGGFVKIGEAPGAESFDSAGKYVVAGSSWDDVFWSSDGGVTFSARSVGPGMRIEDVLVRSDGTAIAQARRVVEDRLEGDAQTFVARPKKPFRKASIQPADFYKVGSWLWALADCPTVLAADGERFVRENAYVVEATDRWAEALALTSFSQARPLSQPGIVTASRPPPPRYEARLDPKRGACSATEPAGPDEPERPRQTSGPGLKLSMPPVPIRASALSLLSDGICDGTCPAGTRFDSPPHAVRRDSPKLIDLPKDCVQPFNLRNAPGLPLLFCHQKDRTRVFALDRDNTWHAEGTLAEPLEALGDIAVASDGTVRVPGSCRGEKCRAFIRAPLAAGKAEAWRPVSARRAVILPVRGGHALLVENDADDRLSVFLSKPDGSLEKIALWVKIPPNLTSVSVMGTTLIFERSGDQKPHGVLHDNQEIVWSE